MAYNHELTERVRHMLIDIPHVEERKMFGSICFMVNGKLAVCVGDHDGYQLLVRTDPDRAAELLEREGVGPDGRSENEWGLDNSRRKRTRDRRRTSVVGAGST